MKSHKLLCPGENQPKHDLVETPPALAEQIVQYFQPTGIVLDPCRGNGAFYNAFSRAPGVTDTRWCEILEGRDFFREVRPCNWLLTNPPWSILRRFLNHAMTLTDNIVFLVTLTHLDTRARDREIEAAGFGRKEVLIVPQPPAPWPTSGFLLTAYHLQRGYTGPLTFTRSMIEAQPSAWRTNNTCAGIQRRRIS